MVADTALIVAVDISRSVSEGRYRLQVEGIARALEDPSVVAAITGGLHGRILFALVTWADKPTMSIGWRLIANKEDAARTASLVRNLRRQDGQLTCLSRMLNAAWRAYIPSIPLSVRRVVLDVSGDNVDDCDGIGAVHAERDEVLAKGATINGLPILLGGADDLITSGAYRPPGFDLQELPAEQAALDQWYRDHVIGGPGAFTLVAHGYSDFARALRAKLLIEISATRNTEFDRAPREDGH